MRILIAAKFTPDGSRPMGGVQSWISAVRHQLRDLGHLVDVWEPGFEYPTSEYDLGIFAHPRCTKMIDAFCKKTVWISHGIIPEERPPERERVLFVSHGVRVHWLREHWPGEGPILRQPIDTAFWSPRPMDRNLVLRFSYRRSATVCREAAEIVAREIGADLEYHHVSDASPLEARDLLTRALVVFASGRAALEAMSCAAPTVIYDNRSAYQRALLASNAIAQIEQSYSGRGGAVDPNAETVAVEALRAIELGGAHFRQHVLTHHRAGLVVAELLKLCED